MYHEVRRWMYRNARPLELALWRFHFEGGDAQPVLNALACYQNEDGGFGHALEADCWNPGSTPVATQNALRIMQEVGMPEATQPMLQGVWRYLRAARDHMDYGWRFTVPENDAWPHAPWWTWDEAGNPGQTHGVTAALSAFILRYACAEDPLYALALKDAQRMIDDMMHRERFGEAFVCLSQLLDVMDEQRLPYHPEARERLSRLVNGDICRDPARWTAYAPRPSRYIRSRDSRFLPGNEEIVRREVAFLRETRQGGGVWPITWTWFDMMGRYGAEFFVAENWWKAVVAIENMLFLREFDTNEQGGENMIDSRCGLHCTGCEYKEKCGCGGCIETNGHPFHGECPVALCCQRKGIVHCGQCPDMPCELLQQYSCDPEHGDHPQGARIEQCRRWAEHDQ